MKVFWDLAGGPIRGARDKQGELGPGKSPVGRV